MTTKWIPEVGDIGLVPSPGMVGKLIRVGQWLNGDGYSHYEHAFIVTAVSSTNYDRLEAKPSGAGVANHFRSTGVVFYSHPAFAEKPHLRDDVVFEALKYRGTPYSYLDYFAIAAHRFHIPAPHLKNYIATTKHMICSQLVDQVYLDAGIHLFNDGRWPGWVTPGDLYQLAATE